MCIVSKPHIPDPVPPPKAASAPSSRAAEDLKSKNKADRNVGRKSTLLTGPRGAPSNT